MKPSAFLLFLAAAVASLAIAPTGANAQASKQAVAQPSIVAACQAINEATGVQQALNRFDSALAAHDIDQLQAAGIEPTSAKGWQRFFKSNPEAKITDSCPVTDLYIAGDTANWSCKETSDLISQGKPMQYAHLIRFTFTRKNGAWTISDRK